MSYVFDAPPVASLTVEGSTARFPVRRIYVSCVHLSCTDLRLLRARSAWGATIGTMALRWVVIRNESRHSSSRSLMTPRLILPARSKQAGKPGTLTAAGQKRQYTPTPVTWQVFLSHLSRRTFIMKPKWSWRLARLAATSSLMRCVSRVPRTI